MARIISSEEPIGGVGYQYNVEGMGGIIAVITKHGPGIASQGEVESLLFSAAMVDSALDGEVPKPILHKIVVTKPVTTVGLKKQLQTQTQALKEPELHAPDRLPPASSDWQVSATGLLKLFKIETSGNP